MEGILSSLKSLGSYHLVAWGSLLGMELYQSFIMTKVCYLYLPRPQFATLQKRVFQVYFNLQVGLVVVITLTYPSGSIVGLASNVADAAILGVTLGLSVLNASLFGPRTSRAMVEKNHQETRDAQRKETDVSEEMKLLKRKFSFNHAMAIHLNLIASISTIFYGLRLGAKIV